LIEASDMSEEAHPEKSTLIQQGERWWPEIPNPKEGLRFREKAGGRGFEANTLSLPSSDLIRGSGYFSPLISSLKVIDGP